MKIKNLLLCGVFSLALVATACSVDETKQVNDANSITFKATVPYATRAAATTANSLGSFSVWAWTDDETGKTTFMNHVPAVNNGSGTYTTSPLYFWPTTSVDFLGLSPLADGYDGDVAYLGGTIVADVEDDTDPYYTGHVAAVTAGATTVTYGENSEYEFASYGTVMVDVPSSHEDQIDLCYAVATEQTSGSVAMNFRHALSQVVFAAKNTNPEMSVSIAGVSVCSVYKTGQYALPKVSTKDNLATDAVGTGGIASSQGLWTLGTAYGKSHFSAGLGLAADSNGNPTEAITLSDAGSPADVLTASDGALFLIPQEVAAWDVLGDKKLTGFGSYFRILCNITEDGAQIWPNSVEEGYYESSSGAANIIMIGGVEYAEIAVPVEVAWEEGYKYTYTFVFGEGAGYYPPDDPNTDYDGEPVLVPISFTVSVDEFQKTEEAEVSTDTEEENDDDDGDDPEPVADIIPFLTDTNFAAYALENFDTDENGMVSSDEAATVTRINCTTAESFEGIEYFPNLERLESVKGKLAGSLDLSKNTKLTYIDVGETKVTDIDLRNTSMTTMTGYACYDCESLTSVELPECTTSIGTYAFYSCDNLASIEIPDGVTTIGECAFYNCKVLPPITLPDALVTIDGSAFRYCYSMTYITIPAKVESIGKYAFQDAPLETVTVLATTPPTLGDTVFRNLPEDAMLYVPAGCVETYASSDWGGWFTDIREIED